MPEGESSIMSIKLFIGCFTFSADLDLATTEVDDGRERSRPTLQAQA